MENDPTRRGMLYGVVAYAWWGLVPLYFRWVLGEVTAAEMLAHRVVWSLAFLAALLTFARRWPALARVPWIPAVGDGVCSNVGAGAVRPDTAALMVGTSGALRVVRRLRRDMRIARLHFVFAEGELEPGGASGRLRRVSRLSMRGMATETRQQNQPTDSAFHRTPSLSNPHRSPSANVQQCWHGAQVIGKVDDVV